jgi:hypothetical protein
MKVCKIRISILIVLSISVHFSCNKDFLDTPPSNQIVRQQYISDLKSCQDFLVGTLADLAQYMYNGYNIIYADLLADNVKPTVGQTSLSAQYNWAQIASDRASIQIESAKADMNSLWMSGYRIIRNSSFLIENVDRFKNEDSTQANYIKGQAFALRALCHFQLVNVFAQPYKFSSNATHPGIPYVTTSDWTKSVVRKSVAEVYANIISDLKSAITLLPISKGSLFFMNQNAAKAILARVYLFASDYQNAKEISKEVSIAVPIMMRPDYPSKLYTTDETEALFQLPPEQVKFYTLFPAAYYTLNKKFVATNDIVSLLNESPSDARKEWVKLSDGDWMITKFPIGVRPNDLIPELSYYLTIIRSSEMFLTAAESYAKLGMDDSARFYLDAIRIRADPYKSVSVASGMALLDSIYKERRKELCFENFRFFDLLRTGSNVDRKDAINPTAKYLAYPNPKAVAPIPNLDVLLSGLEQNPGY